MVCGIYIEKCRTNLNFDNTVHTDDRG